MQINERIKHAARKVVQEQDVGNGVVTIPGYQGLVVAKEGHVNVSEMFFFTENNERYAIGVMKK